MGKLKDKVTARNLDNKILLGRLKDYIDKHDKTRFIQALVALDILPDISLELFYEESGDTLNRVYDKKKTDAPF